MLVRHGANITARDTMNDTPLHRTCRRGHPGITDFLLRTGSPTRGCFNSTGEEPLTLAVRYNRSAQSVQMLRARAAMRDASATDASPTGAGRRPRRPLPGATSSVTVAEPPLPPRASPSLRMLSDGVVLEWWPLLRNLARVTLACSGGRV